MLINYRNRVYTEDTGFSGESIMKQQTQIRVKPSVIIQCVQEALESIGKDSSEAAAARLLYDR